MADDPLRGRAEASTVDAGATMSSGAGALPPSGSPPLGFVAAARYEIGQEVAAGGMGRIHLAKDVLLGRTIALKLPRQAGTGAEERLRQEALITARLQHPGIVPIYEAGRLTSGQTFYAMRWVEGRPLDQEIDAARTRAARIALLPHVIAVARAVAYAHAQQVVHRDLKPTNVLVGRFGEVVVIDWGLAVDLAADAAAGARGVSGTRGYMAPEQARGEAADVRSDVYALGAVLRHTLTGKVDGADATLPADLVAVIDKATADAPAARYADAGALAADLERFQTGQLVGAHRYGGRELLARWARRHRGLLLLGGAALGALAALGAVSVARIARERDHAVSEGRRAERAQATAEERRDALLLAQARVWLDRDPTLAFAWLKAYADAGGADQAAVHALAAEATARGVARHVYRHVKAVALSPDRARVAMVRDGRIEILDVARGAASQLSPDGGDVRGLVWSPDGARVAALGEKRARVFEVARPAAAPRELPLRAPGRAAAFTPDLRALVVGGGGGALEVLPLDGGAARALAGHAGTVRSVEITPDGAHMLTASADGTARLWRLSDGASEVLPDTQIRGGAYAVLSPDGKRVAWAADDGVARWREVAGGAVHLLRGHTKELSTVAFSPDGAHLASGGFDFGVRVWDLAAGTSRMLEAHENVVTRALFAPDGKRLVTSSLNRDVLLWDLETGDRRGLTGHSDTITAQAFSADGATLLIADGDDQLRVWSTPREDSVVLRGHTSPSVGVAAVEGDRPFTISDDGTARLWDVAHGTAQIFETPVEQLGGWNVSRDRRQAAYGAVDSSVWVMDTRSGAARMVGKHDAMVHALDFSPDGARLATCGSDRMVKLWDLATGAARDLTGHEAAVWYLAFSDDGRRIATGGDDGVVRVYDADTGARQDLTGHMKRVSDVGFTPDGRVVSASADTTVRVWDARGGARVLTGHEALIEMLRAGPDGRTLATASDDRTARIWDLATGAARVLPHDEKVVLVVYSEDGRRLATGTIDGAVRVWDVATGHLLAVRRDHDASISEVAITRDGRHLFTSSEDTTVRVVPMPPDRAAAPVDLDAVSTVEVGADERPASPVR